LLIGFIFIGLASSQDNFNCPPQGIHTFAYPWSCRRYIRCIGGTGMALECAPGLYFDALRGQCNTPEAADCNPCRAKNPGELHFARDERNCSRFSMCIGTALSENICAEGLYFDLTSNTCARSETVYCPISEGGGGGNPPGPVPPAPEPPAPGPGLEGSCDLNANFEMIASTQSCSQFTICTCGHPNVRNCPPGLIYDVVSQSCNTREQGQCLSESVPQCPPNEVTILAHPYDCRFQVLCVNGVPTLEACAPGLEVNRQTGKCDFRHISQCSAQNPTTYAELMSGIMFI